MVNCDGIDYVEECGILLLGIKEILSESKGLWIWTEISMSVMLRAMYKQYVTRT